jgi:hypothetical protein
MGHIPEDENFDDFMNASAEEWSKEEEPLPAPEPIEEPTDRWGSPSPVEDPNRWGSEPLETPQTPQKPTYDTPEKNKGSKWWIIAIIVVVLLCIFACVAIVLIFGSVFSIFQSDFSGLIQMPFSF